jgi:hypothetical protein
MDNQEEQKNSVINTGCRFIDVECIKGYDRDIQIRGSSGLRIRAVSWERMVNCGRGELKVVKTQLIKACCSDQTTTISHFSKPLYFPVQNFSSTGVRQQFA